MTMHSKSRRGSVGFGIVLLVACERTDTDITKPGPTEVRGAVRTVAKQCPRDMVRVEPSVDERREGAKQLCIDRTEVSVAAYVACVDDGKCTRPEDREGCNYTVTEKSNHPINCVTQSEAWLYCVQHGKRLPTLPEWDQAMKFGGHSNYLSKDNPLAGRVCWKGDTTCPSGSMSKDKSPTGAVDLLGNVAEWTLTRHSFGVATYRIVGGAWRDTQSTAFEEGTVAFEIAQQVSEAVGMRCVKDLE